MQKTLDCVLLLALPASGKSEVRRYLKSLPPKVCREDFHMGDTVQLDDFPYVHLMRRIDDELSAMGQARLFFQAPDKPFQDGRDWGTLIELVNEDYWDLVCKKRIQTSSAGRLLLDRIEHAANLAGLAPRLSRLDGATRAALAQKLEKEAADLLREKHDNIPDSLEGRTLVIEFARGGPDKASMPLPAPLGYRHSLSLLDPAILERASILYVWVTPEESRRKNHERTDPNDPGSILHHGVPIEVMLKDYGCDDMDWLEQNARRPGTVPVEARGRSFDLPVARFDNRVDRTSFVRGAPESWPADKVRSLHDGLKDALARLAQAWR